MRRSRHKKVLKEGDTEMNVSENTVVGSFNREFCLHLEYHLSRTFPNSDQKELRNFWCDGVSEQAYTDIQLTKKNVNDTRKLQTTAYLGETGQDIYKMIIRFGKYSLRRCARGTSIIDCIPSENTTDWIDVDIENKSIEIRLR